VARSLVGDPVRRTVADDFSGDLVCHVHEVSSFWKELLSVLEGVTSLSFEAFPFGCWCRRATCSCPSWGGAADGCGVRSGAL